MTSSEMTKLATENPGSLYKIAVGPWAPGVKFGQKIIQYGKNLVKPVTAGQKPGFMNSVGKGIQNIGNYVHQSAMNPKQAWQDFGKASKRAILGGGATYVGYRGLKELGEETTMREYDKTIRNRLGAGLMDPSQVPSEKLDQIYGTRPQQ